jgi:hypothetical protein
MSPVREGPVSTTGPVAAKRLITADVDGAFA